jgi:hypothetical protein
MNGKPKEIRYLDAEEREVIESVEALIDNPDFKVPGPARRAKIAIQWKKLARESSHRRPVTLRLQQRDIERLKTIANQKGLPYQTLISSVLHQYASGDLVEP